MRLIRPIQGLRPGEHRAVRPILGIHRYEEFRDLYEWSSKRRTAKLRPLTLTDPRGRRLAFPYGKAAELDSAELLAKQTAAAVRAAGELKQVLDQLDDSRGAVPLEPRSAASSEPDAVAVQAEPGVPIGDYLLEVQALATAQLVRTALYTPDGMAAVAPGKHRLALTALRGSRELDVFVFKGDTHRALLSRLREAVNGAALGVWARLETDETGRIRLALESLVKGAEGTFRLADVSGNAAASLGLRVVDREARDAAVRLGEGEWLSFPSNRIPLRQSGLFLHLLRLPAAPVRLTVRPDGPGLYGKLRSLLQAVEVLQLTLAAAEDRLDPAFASRLAHTLRRADWTALRDREEPHPVLLEQALTGPDSAAAALRQLVEDIATAPSEHLLNRSHPQFTRYANYLASRRRYSQLPSKGLLLNRDL